METDLLSAKKVEKEKDWPQIIAILIGGIAGVCQGSLYAWTSPFIPKISQDKENYDITEDEASYFNIVQPLAMIVACPVFSKLTDVIGRKRTVLFVVVAQIGSWLTAGFARDIYVFHLSRVFTGVGDGIIFASLPIYIGEISNPTVRGTWGNVVSFSYYVGEFLVNVVGSYVDVRETSYIYLPFPIIFFLLFIRMPESPYYYIRKGEYDKAKASLRFLKRINNIDGEFIKLKCDVERQLSESASWSDAIKIKSNRRAILAGVFLRYTQQSAGLNAFIIYTQLIFQKGGGNMSREDSSMLLLGTNVLLNIIALTVIVKRFGRRICYITSLVGTGVLLYIMGTFYYLDSNNNVDLTNFRWIPITTMMCYEVFASFGISTIPTLMLGELFSASIKSKAMAILVLVFGVGNLINNYLFYALNSYVGFYCPFFFFAVCNTIAAVVAYFTIPETRGKTLEEIQQALKKKSIWIKT